MLFFLCVFSSSCYLLFFSVHSRLLLIRNLGYEIFQKNRTNKKGGGVICYVKSPLVAIKTEKQDAENYDSVYVEITHTNKKLIFASVYRPPKLQAADDTALYNEIQSLIQGKIIIVIGD